MRSSLFDLVQVLRIGRDEALVVERVCPALDPLADVPRRPDVQHQGVHQPLRDGRRHIRVGPVALVGAIQRLGPMPVCEQLVDRSVRLLSEGKRKALQDGEVRSLSLKLFHVPPDSSHSPPQNKNLTFTIQRVEPNT